MKKGKLIAYTALSIVILFLSIFIIWWAWVYYYAPNKEVHNTFELDTIATEDGSQEDYIIKVKYFSNENDNGVEALEVVFNSFIDERNDRIYQQGIQIVADEGKRIGFKYENDPDTYVKDKGWWSWFVWYEYGHEFGTFDIQNSSVNYYTSFDNFYTVEGSTKNFADDGFKITLRNQDNSVDNFLLRFNGHVFDNTIKNDSAQKKSAKNFVSIRERNPFAQDYDIYQYYDYDINYFCMMILNAVHDIRNGVHHSTLMKLGDTFKYSILTSNNVYEEVSSLTNEKVSVLNNTFAAIYFEKTADGLKKSSESMFGLVNHSNGFNISNEEVLEDDYFVGQTVFDLTEDAFDLLQVHDNHYKLKLKESIKEKITLLNKSVSLSIHIDLDVLSQEQSLYSNGNVIFDGFYDDLSVYNIFDCYTTRTVNGEIVRTEVEV